jgi:glycosyltransferase involved in cell wall biosynthesis
MNSPGQERILALIPAYNEAARIGAVIEGARRHLPVLVVDDGSTDDTSARAKAAGADVVRHEPNRGKGAALLAGFARALDGGWEAAVTLDADGQHDPAEIPAFLEAYRGGADLVIGARDFSRMPRVRRLANSLGRRAFSWALGRDVPDNQSGYRLVGRRLMEAMLASRETGFELEVDMIVACVRLDLKLRWVGIRTIYAGETSHIRALPHVLNFLRIVGKTRRGARAPR